MSELHHVVVFGGIAAQGHRFTDVCMSLPEVRLLCQQMDAEQLSVRRPNLKKHHNYGM